LQLDQRRQSAAKNAAENLGEKLPDLDFDLLSLLFDVPQLVELSLAAARTGLARLLPGCGIPQVRVPPGPGFALSRSCRINRAVPFLGIEEDAIPVGELL
jgi:hypothetical protein